MLNRRFVRFESIGAIKRIICNICHESVARTPQGIFINREPKRSKCENEVQISFRLIEKFTGERIIKPQRGETSDP